MFYTPPKKQSSKGMIHGYMNVRTLHIKINDLDDSISHERLEFIKSRLENMFDEVEERFREYGRPVRIITRLTPDKLGVMSYDGKQTKFYIVDTTQRTVSKYMDYETAKTLASHDITYIRRAQVLGRQSQIYPGQPAELFSEIEAKLNDPARAGPKDYTFDNR